MKLVVLLTVAVFMSCICGVMDADAAATVKIKPSPDGSVYSVSVIDVANAPAIDFTITYDATALSNPVVNDSRLVTDAAAYRELNVSKPGELRVVYLSVKGFNKSGELATVVFTKKSSAPARAPKLEAKIYSPEGPQVATRPVVTVGTGSDVTVSQGVVDPLDMSERTAVSGNMGKTAGLVNASDSAKQTTSVNQTSNPLTDQKALGMPEEKNAEERPLDTRSQPAVPLEATNVNPTTNNDAGTTAGDSDKKNDLSIAGLKSLESIVDRFKAYKGPRTLKGFSELFDGSKLKAAGVVQTPKIAVSDGKRMIAVNVSLPTGSAVPSFSLKGANLKGLKTLTDRSLELDALPQKGKLDVRMSIVMLKEVAEIPLTVVPPVSGEILELSEQALEKLLLKADGKNKSLFYDLNADGKQDYLDDYILVAHWLLKQPNDKKIPASKAADPR